MEPSLSQHPSITRSKCGMLVPEKPASRYKGIPIGFMAVRSVPMGPSLSRHRRILRSKSGILARVSVCLPFLSKVLYKPVPFILMGNILLLLAQVGCIFWNGCHRGRVEKSLVALSQEGASLNGFALLGPIG